MAIIQFYRFFFPPGPAGPLAFSVFIPDARIISISSNLREDEYMIRMVIVMVVVVMIMIITKNAMMMMVNFTR